jgi:hypothetical protein
MQADFSRMSLRTDDEMRTMRLARGLRAEPVLERIERSLEHH